jgi:hypothetical protein
MSIADRHGVGTNKSTTESIQYRRGGTSTCVLAHSAAFNPIRHLLVSANSPHCFPVMYIPSSECALQINGVLSSRVPRGCTKMFPTWQTPGSTESRGTEGWRWGMFPGAILITCALYQLIVETRIDAE